MECTGWLMGRRRGLWGLVNPRNYVVISTLLKGLEILL